VTIAECFKGLADQTRLRMLNLLFRGELCGCDIQFVLRLSQSNVSRHLAYLKRAGLVTDRRDGYRVFYRLRNSKGTGEALLFDYLRRALGSDPVAAKDLKELKRAIREGACSVSERASPRTSRAGMGERRAVESRLS
jgi:ArsR family transcriptional regulator